MQFYYFIDGVRKGPIETAQLKTLAALGKIQKETEVELEDGRRIQARKIKGLTFKGETPEENADGGDIYGVAEPVAPPPPVAPSVPPTIDDLATELLGGAPAADAASSETPVPPVDVPVAEPSVPQPTAAPEASAPRGKFASVVLFALSSVFLTAALVAALVGGMQLKKTERASDGAEYEERTTVIDAENKANDAKNETEDVENKWNASTVLAPSDERLGELDAERKRHLELLDKFLEASLLDTESDLVAYKATANWQLAALEDARRRPSASVEAYMNALDRLNFRRHEFVGGDAYNLEVNASLFTGLGVLGVGTDVRDVGDKVRALGTDVRDVGDKVRALGTDVRDVGDKVQAVEANLRAVGTDVQAVGISVRSASAVIAAGAGFVCAALFASTSALLFGLGLLARRQTV